MKATVWMAVLLLALLGCGDGTTYRENPRARLAGTWQREMTFDGAKGRATIILAPEGKFTERLQVTGPGGNVEKVDFAGVWLTDGSSFTLRYLQENGRPYSGGKIHFLTLLLTSVTPREFTGRDELGSRDVSYQRAESGQL